MQLFAEKNIKLWNGWEVRILILLSLLLQIILVILGSRRKVTAKIWTRILVWSAYLTADWVATVALGCLARSQEESEDNSSKPNNVLQAFWAPFLLLHLGGPDAITAYSLEDNELWLRHFLGLIVEVGVSFHVFMPSWSKMALTFISIPMFITGMIKYGERTLVLRSSSSQYLKDSLLSDPDPGPDIVKIQNKIERRHRRQERLAQYVTALQQINLERGDNNQTQLPTATPDLSIERTETGGSNQTQTMSGLRIENMEIEDFDLQMRHPERTMVLQSERLSQDSNYLEVAYFLFGRFRYLFSDLILSFYEREDSCSQIEKLSAEDAFKLVAVELGFMYDVLYTKANIVYSQFGILFRFISFFCSISALVSFSMVINIHSYSPVDISITYILLVSVVVLEVYAFIALFFSDWTQLWFIKLGDKCHDSQVRATCPCNHSTLITNGKRWSGSMAQYNLINSCLQDVQPTSHLIQKLPLIGKLLAKYQYLTWEDVNVDLQNMIFRQLLEKSNVIKRESSSVESCKKLLAQRGDYVLKERYGLLDRFRWSTHAVEFDHSLLLWHIATDVCYYSEDANRLDKKCRTTKCLSDYMLYLLIFYPSMLPEGIGEIRYRDAYAEATRFFLEEESRCLCWTYVVKKKKFIEQSEACKALLQVNFGPEVEQLKGDKSQSVLFYGCRLAKQLQDLKFQNGWSRERQWELISQVWVEMLLYAANKCRWKEHAQQASKRWRAAHSCPPSYGTSWLERTISNPKTLL